MVSVECDLAKALGQCLINQINGKRAIVVIDNVSVNNGEYIDYGYPVLKGTALPLVVKTIITGTI
jgi:ethanolamine utilization protein EutA